MDVKTVMIETTISPTLNGPTTVHVHPYVLHCLCGQRLCDPYVGNPAVLTIVLCPPVQSGSKQCYVHIIYIVKLFEITRVLCD